MRIIWCIIIKEFNQLKRDPRLRATIIIAPILQLLLMGYAATTDVNNISLAVCDLDKSVTSREFTRSFVSSGYFTVERNVNEYNSLDKLIDNGTVQVALVIPPNFGAFVEAQKSAPVQLLVDGSDGYTAGIALGYAGQIAGAYNQHILQQTISRTGVKPNIGSVNSDIRVWYNPELKSKNFMIPGIVAMLLLITTGMLTAMAIVKEREVGTLEQLIVTPIKPWQLILGKLVPFVIVGIIDVILVLTVGRFWFDVPVRGSVPFLFFCGGIFLLSSLGIGLFVSTVSHSQQQAAMTMQFFIFIPFLYLSGFTFPIENMPRAIQYLTYAIPLRYFLEIVRGIFLKGDGFMNLWPQILAMFIIGVVTLTLSMMRFHKKLE
ncbi:MAG: ABC transporter permease [Bacteroidota bacterium]|nr:ABC transporter permease [Bacteroidota bacterium]MDP4230516.1 ABC transporter permease [Bacteroidota bacterium]MDP4235519.1 ABC transporter permease [Bacteroidota bacterium]